MHTCHGLRSQTGLSLSGGSHMQSVMIVVLGIAGMSFGWFVYSKFIATKIYQLDADFVTPAHELNDGVDYHPTNKYVLWGHHFTSVAGAAPIVGPAIAVYWGWVPAVLWVTIGTIFFAGVHDFGAIWASARHKGKSIGALSEEVIGSRTRALFMIVIFLVLLMVNAVFGVVIASAFVSTSGAVFPCLVGNRGRTDYRPARAPEIQPDVAVHLGVWRCMCPSTLAAFAHRAARQMFGLTANANWIIILFIYAAIASMLPVWVLLQPRDFINGMQLLSAWCSCTARSCFPCRIFPRRLSIIRCRKVRHRWCRYCSSPSPAARCRVFMASCPQARPPNSLIRKRMPVSSVTWARSAKARWR